MQLVGGSVLMSNKGYSPRGLASWEEVKVSTEWLDISFQKKMTFPRCAQQLWMP
jgi:hypothetical protein